VDVLNLEKDGGQILDSLHREVGRIIGELTEKLLGISASTRSS
jgi:hypothetical protein